MSRTWWKQVRRTLSLAALEALALEMAAIGKARGKLGIVGVKRSAGRGQETPILLVVAVERGVDDED